MAPTSRATKAWRKKTHLHHGPTSGKCRVERNVRRLPRAPPKELAGEKDMEVAAPDTMAANVEEDEAAAAAVEAAALAADGFARVDAWEKFELHCVFTHARLTDPAKCGVCRHRACCNYEALRG